MQNLILSGGGINGLIHLGVLKLLDEYNLIDNIINYYGSSIGALIAFHLALGYNYNDIMYLFLKIESGKLIDENVFTFFTEYGLCNLSKIKTYLENIVEIKFNKKSISFLELYNLNKKTIHITSVNINLNQEQIFNYINTPDVNIVDAVVASSSIPIAFTPKKINENYYIDSFYINNYPLNLCTDYKNTIGIELNNVEYKNIENIDNIYEYLSCIFISTNTIIKKYKEKKTPKLEFNIKCKNPLNFFINPEEKIDLYNYGYNESKKIIKYYIKKHAFKVIRKYILKEKKKNKYINIYHLKIWYKFYLKLLVIE